MIFNFSAHKDFREWGAEGGLHGKMHISRCQVINSDLESIFGDPLESLEIGFRVSIF